MPTLGVTRRAIIAERTLHGLEGGDAPLPSDLVLYGPHVLNPTSEDDTTAIGRYLFRNLRVALDEGRGVRVFFPHVARVRILADLDSTLSEPDVAVVDYRGVPQRGPAALLWLRRAAAAWRAGQVREALASLDQAERLAAHWEEQVPAGRWRDRGATGIRELARQGLRQMEASAPPPGPAEAARVAAVRERLQRLAAFRP
jgi:hypothetical protein